MKQFVFALALAGGCALAGSLPAQAAESSPMQHGTAMGHDSGMGNGGMGHAAMGHDRMRHSAAKPSAMGPNGMGHATGGATGTDTK